MRVISLRKGSGNIERPNVGKWSKHQHLAEDEFLLNHLPKTELYSPEALWTYAQSYNQVILKPSGGGGGAGLIQLTRMNKERYLIQTGKVKRVLQGKEATINFIQSRFLKRLYLLQPRISLACIEGRPFDIRVMIQRKSSEEPWVVTGLLAKLAGPGFVVTNIARSGGEVLPLDKALKLSKIPVSSQLTEQIYHLSITVAKKLGEKYPTLREIGLDLGIDVTGKPWIIEANFRPATSLFQRLKDQTYYRRIKSVRRAYWQKG
ncbi:YheC/YheD family protein [Brevibacillus ginsengisoli]|uniref:YheC/YheD family protein n=1 Tax=Brevibacillus ginsengisoli TaxID=363854 RepID=UPI003CFA43E2